MAGINMGEFERWFTPAENPTPSVDEMAPFEADFQRDDISSRAVRGVLRANLNELSAGEQRVLIGDTFQSRMLELYYQEYAKALASYPPGRLDPTSPEGQMLIRAGMRDGFDAGVQDLSPEIDLSRNRRVRVLGTIIGTQGGSPWPLPEGNILSGETAGVVGGVSYSYDRDRSMKIADYFGPLLALKYAKITHARETIPLTGEQDFFFIPLDQESVKIRPIEPLLHETT